MTRTAGDARAGLAAWSADLLRLTAFFAPGPVPEAGRWWTHLTGTEPESSTNKPRTGELTDSGRIAGAIFEMQFQPGRVDWLLAEPEEPDAQAPPAMLPDRLETFSRLMAGWLGHCPPLQRLAFGAVLTLRVDDRAAGYRTISNYLNFDVDSDTSSDFSYKINRARPSATMPGVRINRLMKWGVVHLIRYAGTLSPAGGVLTGEDVATSHRCRLELDINTAPESSGALQQDQLPRLFGEMIELAQEIVNEGDVP